mgnify:FL=1
MSYIISEKEVYILKAKGSCSWHSGVQQITCKYAFTTKEAAEAYIPEFRLACVTSVEGIRDLNTLEDNDVLKIFAVRLELR